MTETKLVQGTPLNAEPEPKAEIRLSSRDRTLIQAGGLLMSHARRSRDEVEDLVMIQQIKDSGLYTTLLDEAGADSAERPWEVFCKMIGWRKKTLNERLYALREYGPEVMRLISDSGLPHTGVRALLAAPNDMREQVARMAKSDTPSVDALRGIVDQIEAINNRAERERNRADAERKRADKAEHEAAKRARQAADLGAAVKDMKAELQNVRDGKRITNEADALAKLTQAKNIIENAVAIIGMVNPRSSEPAAARLAAYCLDIGRNLLDQGRQIDGMLDEIDGA